MAVTLRQKNMHLWWRAGFGPSAADIPALDKEPAGVLFKRILAASKSTPPLLDVTDQELQQLVMGSDESLGMSKMQLSPEQRKMLREASTTGLKNLNLAWLTQMITSSQQLREKMSLFWHGHFATRTINIIHQQKLLEVIRNNALGRFGDLLRGVSKSGAMINFLNNNQNRKDHPNENFARELMELFTLGRGHYSEDDIKESARAFTGWGADLKGEFVFRPRQHDEGQKTFLGHSGNYNGDEIINIILEQKQTALFITGKIYRYFVHPDGDTARIATLADRFYRSNYDISDLMTAIFTADWFFDEKNIGTKIKSPVELLVGIRRKLPMQLENEQAQLLVQRLLGQTLFYPPNVAGWPGGKSWIDSSTLMTRLRLPQLIYAGDTLNLKPKDDDDTMMGMKDREQRGLGKKNGLAKPGQRIGATIQWDQYIPQFASIQREDLLDNLRNLILIKAGTLKSETVLGYADASSREKFIQTVTVGLMSTPEYQLC
ncbi:MAG: DUF1800 domain-containing protein [Bacteroidota bacterium]|nr:DUF1800 domain-containing protein [Bacteroidota bacterium]